MVESVVEPATRTARWPLPWLAAWPALCFCHRYQATRPASSAPPPIIAGRLSSFSPPAAFFPPPAGLVMGSGMGRPLAPRAPPRDATRPPDVALAAGLPAGGLREVVHAGEAARPGRDRIPPRGCGDGAGVQPGEPRVNGGHRQLIVAVDGDPARPVGAVHVLVILGRIPHVGGVTRPGRAAGQLRL